MKVGPKEAEVRALRERRAAGKRYRESPVAFVKKFMSDPKLMPFQETAIKALTEADASKPVNAPVEASAPAKETIVKKRKAKKTKKRLKAVSTGKADTFKVEGLAAAKKKAKQPKAAKTGVPALEVAAFICREGGASMPELVKEFGIEAHPMRAKIHYVRHKLGYGVETKDGRYHGAAPKEA